MSEKPKKEINLRFFVKETSSSLVRLCLQAPFPDTKRFVQSEEAFSVSIEEKDGLPIDDYLSNYHSLILDELYKRFRGLIPENDNPNLECIIIRKAHVPSVENDPFSAAVPVLQILVVIRPFWKSVEWPSEKIVKKQGKLPIYPGIYPVGGERAGNKKICKKNISFVIRGDYFHIFDLYSHGYYCFEENALKKSVERRLKREKQKAIRDIKAGRFVGLKAFVRNVVWRSGLDKSYYLSFDEKSLRGVNTALLYTKVFKIWLNSVKSRKKRRQELISVLHPFMNTDHDLEERIKIWASFKPTKFKDKRKRLLVEFAKTIKTLHRKIRHG